MKNIESLFIKLEITTDVVGDMTLVVCLQGIDGIVVASDSRGTFGDPRGITAQNDTIKKVYIVENVGILTAGSPQGIMIINELEGILKKENITGVSNIMEKLREVARSKFDEWFKGFPHMPTPGQNSAFTRPNLHFTIVGYDSDGEPKMYSMVSMYDFAPTLHDYGFALGGVAQYALYLLNRLYSPKMSVDYLAPLGAYVVTETATQDGKVGGPVQIAVIKPDKSHILNRKTIDKIISDNEKRASRFRDLFMETGKQ